MRVGPAIQANIQPQTRSAAAAPSGDVAISCRHGRARPGRIVRGSLSGRVMVVASSLPLSHWGFSGERNSGFTASGSAPRYSLEQVVDQGEVAEPVTGHVLDVHVGEEPRVGDQQQASLADVPEQGDSTSSPCR